MGSYRQKRLLDPLSLLSSLQTIPETTYRTEGVYGVVRHDPRVFLRPGSQDQPGQERLSQYILLALFLQQRMRYHGKSYVVIYRTKIHRVLKFNFEISSVLEWITAVTAHIPNEGGHLLYYSYSG